MGESDAQRVQAVLAGDRSAFGDLYDRHAGWWRAVQQDMITPKPGLRLDRSPPKNEAGRQMAGLRILRSIYRPNESATGLGINEMLASGRCPRSAAA